MEVNATWGPPATPAAPPPTSEPVTVSPFAPPAPVAAPTAVPPASRAVPPAAADDPDATIDRHELARLRAREAERPPAAPVQPVTPDAAGAATQAAPAAAPGGTGAIAPGWYPDPWQRAEHRWHDGEGWTSTVATGATTWVDAPA